MILSGYTYTASAGETMDGIAEKLFQDTKYAAELWCVNPELDGKEYMTGGETVLVPLLYLPGPQSASLPKTAPWKG